MEVRAKLGDRVEAGATLLVIDSSDITAAYSEFVKELGDGIFHAGAGTRGRNCGHQGLGGKISSRLKTILIKARAEFRRAKERLLSLRIPAQELEKPLAQLSVLPRASR